MAAKTPLYALRRPLDALRRNTKPRMGTNDVYGWYTLYTLRSAMESSCVTCSPSTQPPTVSRTPSMVYVSVALRWRMMGSRASASRQPTMQM